MKIEITGIIGEDVLASDIIAKIDEAARRGAPIDFIVSSPGGIVDVAMEIADYIRNYEGTTTAYIAFAASAASFMCCACDSVVAYPGSVYMLHSASQLVNGPARLHRKSADQLDGYDSILAEAYSSFSGLDVFKIIDMMAQETWIEGEDIHSMGFATIFDDSEDAVVPAAANAREQFQSMAAAYADRAQDVGRVSALQSWVRDYPGNEKIQAIVNEAIAAGKTEREVRARLMVAQRGPALTREDIKAAAAVGMSLEDYRKYMPRAEGV